MAYISTHKSSKPILSFNWVAPFNDVNSELNQWQTEASTFPFRHPDRAWIAHSIAVCHQSRYMAT